MSRHRKKMCEHCAFRTTSLEMSNGERCGELIGESMHRTFYCHETMFQENPEQSKWFGEFDPARKKDGSPAKMKDHQICAGFALMFGGEMGMDVENIPTENHHFCGDHHGSK